MTIEKLGYDSRESRVLHLYENYKKSLTGSILDIGCDNRYLKTLLSPVQKYVGVDIASSPDIKLDLEKEHLPFEDNSFDTVVCLDVLEHLNNLYEVSDKIIKVSRENIIISLPNCWGGFKSAFLRAKSPKFYGLPPNKPLDRHKWFFNANDAISFFESLAKKNNLTITKLVVLVQKGGAISRLVAFLTKLISKKHYINFFANSIWVEFKK